MQSMQASKKERDVWSGEVCPVSLVAVVAR